MRPELVKLWTAYLNKLDPNLTIAADTEYVLDKWQNVLKEAGRAEGEIKRNVRKLLYWR
jgi:hypothetical protein